jgi:hypothetical protein
MRVRRSFVVAEGGQFTRAIRIEDAEKKENHEGVAQYVRNEKQKKLGEEVIRVLPWDGLEESEKENSHQVGAGIGQVGNWPVKAGGLQQNREKRDENSAKNRIPDKFAAHKNVQTNGLWGDQSVRANLSLSESWDVESQGGRDFR